MVALADRANDSGYCFPGIRDLASRTELSGRTILRCILDLEAGGWIQVNRNAVGPLLRGNSYVVDVVKLR
jgi:DNA-binding transcriptional regulator YhcF (GntR family)